VFTQEIKVEKNDRIIIVDFQVHISIWKHTHCQYHEPHATSRYTNCSYV